MLMRLLTIVFLLFITPVMGEEKTNDTKRFHQLLDAIWVFELSQDPFQASQLGHTPYLSHVPDISPQGLEHGFKARKGFIQQLKTIDLTSLSRSDQITWKVQNGVLNDAIARYQFNTHYMPFTSEYGFHMAISSLPTSTVFKDLQDYQAYIARVAKLGSYVRQQIQWMKQGIAKGYIMPGKPMEGFGSTISAMAVDTAEASTFYTPIQNSTLVLPSALVDQHKHNLNNDLLPALRTLNTFYRDEYAPAMRATMGIDKVPNGIAFYQNRVKHFTTTNKTPQEIHTIGLQEVARIASEMQEVMDSLAFKGSLQEFIQYLRTDTRFYAETPEELIEYASYLSKKMDARLPQLFHTNQLPRIPYGVEPVPEAIAPKYTTGRYVAPRNDKQPGYYWVNTYALNKRPKYALPALTLHEAVPGHHLQISLAREMTDLPPVRRFTYISAFGEGWGLYSEYLGGEVGMYEDPYDEFGRLSYEMWRACRLVIDTGLHSMGWTRQQALDYMTRYTALSTHNIKTEIDRYITWPGQALSYKIGEITIKELRKKSELTLGDAFDVRDFHHEVLKHGSIPLDILEENIELYLQRR